MCIRDSKHVVGLKCVKMRLGEPDASGRRSVSPIEGSEFVIVADAVIVAIGTTPNPLLRSTTPGLESNRKGCLIVNEEDVYKRQVSIRSPKDAFDLGIGMIHQHFKLVDVLTAAENIILGLPGKERLDIKAVAARVRDVYKRQA